MLTEQLREVELLVNCLPAGLRAYHRSELQLGGGAPPCVKEGLLGLPIEAVVVKAAHTQRVTEGASSGCKEQ